MRREKSREERGQEERISTSSEAIVHYSESCLCHLKVYPIAVLYQYDEVFLIPFQSYIV